MTSITTSVVVVVAPLIGVYLVFLAVAHGVRDAQDSEVEVKLFPPTIRRRVKRTDRRHLKADAASKESAGVSSRPSTSGAERATLHVEASPASFRQREQTPKDRHAGSMQ